MDFAALQSAMGGLWKDVDASVQFPIKRPLLAHYTSLKTIDLILQSKEVWFSNPLYMNDYEELGYGIHLAANYFPYAKSIEGALSSDHHKMLEGLLRKMFGEFNNINAFDVYVFCASEHDPDNDDGLLSMWRGYGAGGKGTAVVIDTSKLRFRPGSPITLGPVSYLSSTQREAWMVNFCDRFAATLKGLPLDATDLPYVATVFFERIRQFALYTKHVGFREEREWRAVYIADRDNANWCKHFIEVRHDERGGVAPKFKFQFLTEDANGPTLGIPEVIHKIILGPGLASDLNSTAARRLLLATSPTLGAPIVASTTPYRAHS
ncbi:MAG: hypothetical protein JWQ07_176 [Ramlibacter sp.]|nr:hypothetical protein [Ramlibacter sp.]